MNKTCKICGEAKEADLFPKSGNRCKECVKHYSAAWRAANKERIKEYGRKYHLDNKEAIQEYSKEYRRRTSDLRTTQEKWENWVALEYGIDPVMYLALQERQSNKCPICNRLVSELTRPLVVDHDHSTMEIRGLLCYRCNFGLGAFKDDQEILMRASLYLQQNRTGLFKRKKRRNSRS
jgi:hypothetical protein